MIVNFEFTAVISVIVFLLLQIILLLIAVQYLISFLCIEIILYPLYNILILIIVQLIHTLFIHRVFHPHVLTGSNIRYLYNKILQPYLDFDKMIVAMARPTNPRVVMTKSALTPPDNMNINHLIEQIHTPRLSKS